MKKKWLDCAKSAALILIMLIVGERIVEYFVDPLSNPIVPAMEDREAYDGTIDTLFIGASVVQDGISPEVYDAISEGVSFNLGCTAQTMAFSYYILEDALRYNTPEYAFIEVSYSRLAYGEAESSSLSRLERIRDLSGRLDMFSAEYGIDDVPKLLFKSARRGLDYIYTKPWMRLTPSYIKEFITNGYALDDTDAFRYGGRGYSYFDQYATADDLAEIPKDAAQIRAMLESDVVSGNFEYLRRIDALCRENGVTPVWISLPTPQVSVWNFGEAYADVTERIFAEAEADGVKYINFSLEDELTALMDDRCFKDSAHMNHIGAEIFTEYLAKTDKQRFGTVVG